MSCEGQTTVGDIEHKDECSHVEEVDYKTFVQSNSQGKEDSIDSTGDSYDKCNSAGALDTSCVKSEPGIPSIVKTSSSLNLGSSASKKRPASVMEEGPVSKRRKQSNIASMFAKAVSKKKEEEAKAAVCPICKKEFDKSVPNTELNAHIDNCLIE